MHCVGMCGGLILASTTSARTVFIYHAGRLLGYMFLGYLSGYLGRAVMHLDWVPIAMGISFIVFAVLVMFKKTELNIPFIQSILSFFMSLKRQVPASVYSGLIGLVSILLPCGWLYTFVLSVSQLKSPLAGAGLLAVFWLGTLPALTILPVFLKKYMRQYSQPISAIIFLVIGITTLFFR